MSPRNLMANVTFASTPGFENLRATFAGDRACEIELRHLHSDSWRCWSCGIFKSWISVAHFPSQRQRHVLHNYDRSVLQQVGMLSQCTQADYLVPEVFIIRVWLHAIFYNWLASAKTCESQATTCDIEVNPGIHWIGVDCFLKKINISLNIFSNWKICDFKFHQVFIHTSCKYFHLQGSVKLAGYSILDIGHSNVQCHNRDIRGGKLAGYSIGAVHFSSGEPQDRLIGRQF